MDIDGIKISELTRANSVTDNDDFVVNSGGTTYKTRFSVVKGIIVQYVNGAIDAINQALVGEVSNRTQADNQLSGRIDAEVTARQSADSTLGGRIDAEVSARGLADVDLGSRISAESTARQSADSALSGRIDAEISARQSADSALSSRIDAEVSARQSVDSEIKQSLADKVGYIGKTYTVVDSVFTSGTGKEVTIPSDGWYYVLAKNGGTSGQLSIYIHTDISLADYLCGVVAASSNYPDSYIRATTPMLPFKSGTKVTIRAFFTDMCELRRMT